MLEFRILKEHTFKFKEGKLYLMLLREGDRFGVEVVDRNKTFGRKYTTDRKEADLLFNTIEKRLSVYNDLLSAEFKIKSCLKKTDLKEMMFLLSLEDREMSQAEIGQLLIKQKFQVKTKYNVCRTEKKDGSITIYVFFDIKKKALGRFYGERFSKKFKWELLN